MRCGGVLPMPWAAPLAAVVVMAIGWIHAPPRRWWQVAIPDGGRRTAANLSKKNAAKMRDALASYIEAGTRIGRGGLGSARAAAGRGRAPATVDRDQNKAIREWAQGKGFEVSDRGRIKQDIVDRYHAEAGR